MAQVVNQGGDHSVTSDQQSRATGVGALSTMPGIALRLHHPRTMLLFPITMEGVTRVLVMATVILRTMARVEARILSFPPRDSRNSPVQLWAAALKGIKQAITTRVLGLKAAVTVVQDVRFMGVSMP